MVLPTSYSKENGKKPWNSTESLRKKGVNRASKFLQIRLRITTTNICKTSMESITRISLRVWQVYLAWVILEEMVGETVTSQKYNEFTEEVGKTKYDILF